MTTPSEQQPSEAGFFRAIREWGLTRGDNGFLGGVVDGLAQRVGMATVPARIIVVIAAIILNGLVRLAYAAAWALLPDRQGQHHHPELRPRHAERGRPHRHRNLHAAGHGRPRQLRALQPHQLLLLGPHAVVRHQPDRGDPRTARVRRRNRLVHHHDGSALQNRLQASQRRCLPGHRRARPAAATPQRTRRRRATEAKPTPRRRPPGPEGRRASPARRRRCTRPCPSPPRQSTPACLLRPRVPAGTACSARAAARSGSRPRLLLGRARVGRPVRGGRRPCWIVRTSWPCTPRPRGSSSW